MIAKSDVIILVVSASALAAGIYRWQSNIAMVPTARTTASAPTAAVLNSNSKSPQTIPNTAESTVNSAVAATNTAVAGNTTAALNGAITTGNTASNGVQNVNAGSTGNTTNENVSQNTTQTSSNSSNTGNNNGNANQPSEPLYGSYRVQSGDYLGKIAETFSTTVATLRSINNIDGSLIEIDQEILYPLPAN